MTLSKEKGAYTYLGIMQDSRIILTRKPFEKRRTQTDSTSKETYSHGIKCKKIISYNLPTGDIANHLSYKSVLT